MTNNNLSKFGVTYTCDKCACSAALRSAVRVEDWQTVKFISENAPTAHAEDCEAPRHPLFTLMSGGLS